MTESDDVRAEVDAFRKSIATLKDEIAKTIVGNESVVDGVLMCLLAGGHALLEGVPGLGKTMLVKTLAEALSLQFSRVQFTPDLMPADILGAEVLETASDGGRAFRFIAGPVFCQLLMADEINRASPRTQSALLQAMQEKHVTIAGQRMDLDEPFHVFATQNPIEQEGTYPLPEAQLDRFLLQIDVGYPDRAAERAIVLATTGAEEKQVEAVFDSASLLAAQAMLRRLPVGESVLEMILDLVRAARPGSGDAHADITRAVAWGPGPRAAQALMLAVRARALLQGRLVPSIDDVMALAQPVLKHRMSLGFAARAEGQTVETVIATLVERVTGREAAA